MEPSNTDKDDEEEAEARLSSTENSYPDDSGEQD